MALWEPNKVEQMPLGKVKRRRPAFEESKTAVKCVWCQGWLDAKEGDFYPKWKKRWVGHTQCPMSPMGCRSYFDEYHFGDPNSLNHECKTGTHLTAGELSKLIEDESVEFSGGYGEPIEIQPTSQFEANQKKEAANHCEDGTCGQSECHWCNPDWKCTRHTPCVNASICFNCDYPMETVKLNWDKDHTSLHHDEGNYHVDTAIVSADALNLSPLINKLNLDEYDANVNPTISVDEDSAHYFHEDGDEDNEYHEHAGLFTIEPLEEPVCFNRHCSESPKYDEKAQED